MVTRLATSLARLSPDAAGIRETATLSNKLVRPFKSNRLTIWYRRLFPIPDGLPELRQIKLFSFSDCGFITLGGNKSAESFIAVAAIPLARDGKIQLGGMILDFPTRKIARTVRSTLCAESIAMDNALGNSIWLQKILIEIVFARFRRCILTLRTGFNYRLLLITRFRHAVL